MFWLIAALVLAAAYLAFAAVNFITGGMLGAMLMQFFLKIHPQSYVGKLAACLFLVAVYLLISLAARLYVRRQMRDGRIPRWWNWLALAERPPMPHWPLLPIAGFIFLLGIAALGVLWNLMPNFRMPFASSRGTPAHAWTMGAILCWGLLQNYRAGPLEKRRGHAPPDGRPRPAPQPDSSLPRPDVSQLIAVLKAATFYHGQIMWRQAREGVSDAFVGPRPASDPLRSSKFFQNALKALGIHDLYQHQQQFADLIIQGKSAVLATPVGSGRSTVCELLALWFVSRRQGAAMCVCPTAQLARHRHAHFTSLLETIGLGWSVRASIFTGEPVQTAPNPQDDRPDVLFVTPDALHHWILPKHKEWALFLGAMRMLAFEDIGEYAGVYGSNCAMVFRRLQRVCRQYQSDYAVAATSVWFPALPSFAQNLLGRAFGNDHIIQGSKKGSLKKTILLWNPPTEVAHNVPVTQRASGDLRRLGCMEEAQKILVEASIQGFNTLVLWKSVAATPADIHAAEETIRQRLRAAAEQRAHAELADLLGSKRHAIQNIKNDIDACIQALGAAPAGGAADAVQQEFISEGAHLLHLISDRLTLLPAMMQDGLDMRQPVSHIIEQARSLLAERAQLVDRISELLATTTTRLAAQAPAAGRGASPRPAMPAWFTTATASIDPVLAMIKGDLRNWARDLDAIQSRFDRIVRRAQDTRRWVASSMLQLQAAGVEPESIDVCLVLGIDAPYAEICQEIEHIGRHGVDAAGETLVCFIADATPLCQYFKHRMDEQFITRGGPARVICLDHRAIVRRHVQCALWESPRATASLADLQDALGAFDPSILASIGEIHRSQGVEIVPSGDTVQERDAVLCRLDAQTPPHDDVELSVCEDLIYAVVTPDRQTVALIDRAQRLEQSAGCILQTPLQRYRITAINDASHVIEVAIELKPSITQKVSTMRLDFEPGAPAGVNISIGGDNSFPINIRGGPARIDETILGYTSHNNADIDNLQQQGAPAQALPQPVKRQFGTFAVVISFPNWNPAPPEQETTSDGIPTGAAPRAVSPANAMHAVAHAVRAVLPAVLKVRDDDIEVRELSPAPGVQALAIFDNVEGSLGLAQSLAQRADDMIIRDLLELAFSVLADCPCADGCPSCSHILQCRDATPNVNLDKAAAIELLGRALRKDDWSAILRRRHDRITEAESPAAYNIRDRILKTLRFNLDIDLPDPVPLLISERLIKEAEQRSQTAIAGFFGGDKVVIREMCEAVAVDVIAHEYGHNYAAHHMDSRLSDPNYIRISALPAFKDNQLLFVEGFAEWMAYRAVDFYGLKYQMESYGKLAGKPFQYGIGFVVLKHIEDKYGAQFLLRFIQTGDGVDFAQVYRDSGAADLLAVELERQRAAQAAASGAPVAGGP